MTQLLKNSIWQRAYRQEVEVNYTIFASRDHVSGLSLPVVSQNVLFWSRFIILISMTVSLVRK